MLVEIPDRYIPMLSTSGITAGDGFFRAPIGSIGCLLIARLIIETHPDDLERYLADFLFGIKNAEMNND